jgi:hypothetical protein
MYMQQRKMGLNGGIQLAMLREIEVYVDGFYSVQMPKAAVGAWSWDKEV